MCEGLSILKSQMNQNSCDISHANTIDMIVHAYTVTTDKLWLNIILCIEVNFFTCHYLAALNKSVLIRNIYPTSNLVLKLKLLQL